MSEKIGEFLLKLGDTDDFLRREAALDLWRLAKKGTDVSIAIPALTKALENDSDWGVRQNAAMVLTSAAKSGTDISGAAPALVNALGDLHGGVRSRAARALECADPAGSVASGTFPAWIDSLRSPDAYVRSRAARALGSAMYKAKVHTAISELIKLLGDDSPEVQSSAKKTLEIVGPKNYGNLRELVSIARKLKREEGFWKPVMELHSKWVDALNERADRIVGDKRFHVPEIKPDKTERVLRVRRMGSHG